jgi:hypothetical protein
MTPDRTAQFRSIGAETTAIATGCIAHWPDKLAGAIESTPVSGNDKSMSKSVKTRLARAPSTILFLRDPLIRIRRPSVSTNIFIQIPTEPL